MRRPLRSIRERGPVCSSLMEPLPVIRRMPDSQVVDFSLADLDIQRIGPRGVEKTITHHGPEWTWRDNRFRDKAVNSIQNILPTDIAAAHNRDCIENEVINKHSNPVK